MLVQHLVGIVIVSDPAVKEIREDECLPVIRRALSNSTLEIVRTAIIPGDGEAIRSSLRSLTAGDVTGCCREVPANDKLPRSN